MLYNIYRLYILPSSEKYFLCVEMQDEMSSQADVDGPPSEGNGQNPDILPEEDDLHSVVQGKNIVYKSYNVL